MNYSDKFGSASFQETSSPLSQKSGFDFTALGSAQQNSHGSVIVDDAHLLFGGQYKRDGLNLVISNDENKIIVADYFKGDARATLSTRDGATLAGKIVDALTGHVTYAQAAGQADPPKEIGTVQKLTGTATAIRNGVSVQLNVGDKVYKSDVLESGGNSALGVIFVDGTVFSLSSNARMVLNEMVYDPNGSSNSSLLSLVQGTITFVAGQTAKNGNMRVDTPVATMGIRGTTVLVKINSADGRVQLSVERDPDGKVGSFVVYDKTTGQIIGTVSREGDKTIVTPALPGQQATTDSTPKTQAEKIADLLVVQQIFQQFFPDVKKDPNNASPGKQGNNGAGAVTPQTELASAQGQGTTTVNNVPVVVTTSGGSVSTTATATIISPPVIITPVSDFQAPNGKSTSFTIGDQVKPDPLIVPYIANSGSITKAETTAPAPSGFDLRALIQFDAASGTVTYNPEDFRFLALGETATYEITFTAQTGPYTPTQTISFTVDGLNDTPIYTANNFGIGLTEPLGTGAASLFFKDGQLRFNDADFSDVASGYTVKTTGVVATGQTIAALPNNAALLNMLTYTGITKAVGTTLGVITEKFSAAASVFDYLALGEKVNLIYSIEVTDAGGAKSTSTLTVTVTGTNDTPTITGATTPATTSGSVFEDGVLAASGVITFRDVDLSDTHTVSQALTTGTISDPLPGFNAATSMLGTLTVSVNENTSDLNNVGTVNWGYTLDNSVAQRLAEGQTITQTYTITITDRNNATVTQDVTVTITGANDGPTIVVDPVDVPGLGTNVQTLDTGAVTEDQGAVAGFLSANGVIVFKDVDLIDSHTASFVLKSSDANADLPGFNEGVGPSAASIGTFALAPVTENSSDTSDIGAVGWTFTLDDSNAILQSLAAGQTITQVYTVTITDNNGAQTTRDVTIVITGVNDDPNNNAPPVIIVDQTDAVGAVVEGNSSIPLTDIGTITFQDIDLIDAHTIPGSPLAPTSVTVTDGQGQPLPLPGFAAADYVGVLTLALHENTADTSNIGTIDWVFSVNDNDPRVQALAAGQIITQTYTVTIDDGRGGVATQLLTVTITGTNDVPVVATVDLTGSVLELVTPVGNLTDTGTITFTDVDLIDMHTINPVIVASNGALGALTASVTTDTTGTGLGGIVTWSYTVAASAVEYLAKDETKVETFTITLNDGNGGTVDRTITVTIVGTNDVPLVATTDVTGGVTEAVTPVGNLTDTGTIAFTDVDLIDGHTINPVIVASNGALGALTASVTTDTTGTGLNGVITWSYSVAASAVEYLAKDETKVETFTITLNDGNGGTVDRTISVTVTGTNDVPLVATTDVTGGVTEAVTPVGNLTDTGTIAFTDVDLIDMHTINPVIVASNGALGALTASVTTDTTGSGLGGIVTWSYSVAASTVEYLAKDETKIETFTVTLNDGNGGTVDRTITVTIVGTNDVPLVATTDVTGAVTELDTTPVGNLTDTGTIAFTDVDLIDMHTINPVIVASNGALGALTASVTTDTTNTGLGGVITWSYSVAASAVEYLAKDETKIETFTVTLNDGNGGTVDRTISVTVTGTNDVPLVATTDVTGSVLELVTPVGNLTDTGTIAFTDVDLIDMHTINPVIVASNGALGALTASVTTDTTGSGLGGVITWSYTVAASAVEYLAKDETKVETFTITLNDGNGGTVDRTITVTIVGTNDVPVVATADVTGGVLELVTPVGNLTDTGTIAFTDVDLIDMHTINPVIVASNGALGALTASVTTDTTGSGLGGVITWSYSVAASAVEYLAKDETKVETFTITLNDGNGGTVDRTISVTVTGTNDVPLVATADVTGSVLELVTPVGNLTDTGTIAFTDVDLIDGHTINPVIVASNGALGALTASVTTDTTNTGLGGVITWSYSVAASAVEYLAKDETKIETFTVTLNDGNGGTVDRTITVTIVGTNDVPLVATADLTGGVLELVTPVGNLTDTGTIAFTDVDLIDGHTINPVIVASNGALGALTASVTTDTTGTGLGGVITWTYSVAASAVEYLAKDETKVETFTITLNDGNGGTVDRTITVTIVGTNDVPQFVAVAGDTQTVTITDTAGVTGDQSFLGHYHYTDVDLADLHGGSGSSLTSTNGIPLGSFGGAQNSEPVGSAPGDAIWSYSILGAKLDALGEGQTVTETGNLIVLDGTGQSFIPITITLVGVNDTPIVTAASLVVSEGGTVAFTAANLGVTDPDNTSFTFAASATHGVFQTTANGTDWIDAASFTSADLAANHVRFVHDGGEDAPTFSIQADDGSSLNHASNVFAGTVSFTNVNDAPVIDAASLFVARGGTAFLEAANVGMTDPDSTSFTYTVSGVTHGKFQTTANGTDWIDASSFTTADLNAHHVRFVHNGDNAAPAFSLQANDGGAVNNLSNTFAATVHYAPFTGTIIGDDNANTLTGTPLNDQFQGFGGDDTIIGLAGFDRAIYTDATGGITANLAAGTVIGPGVGTDTLTGIEGIRGSQFADTYDARNFTGDTGVAGTPIGFNEFEGRGGDDTVYALTNAQGATLTRVSYVNASAGVTVDLAAHTAHGTVPGDLANVGTDTFIGNIGNIFGSSFDDMLLGSNNPGGTVEVFEGRGGDDTINGRGGFDRADYINDTAVTAGIMVDLAAGTVISLDTNPLTDRIGHDTLISVEAVRGTAFDDTYDARGFSGTSTNAGSNGTFNEFSGGGGNDTIFGNGSTRLSYNNATSGVTVDLQTGATPGTGTATGDASVGVDSFSGVNAIQASMFDDTLLGSDNNDTFTGLAGSDFINGRGGFDLSSYNNIYFTTGGIVADLGAGTVTGDASTGTDTLVSIEGIQGTFFADVFTAVGFTSGSFGTFNQFEGLGGDDTITGNGNTKVGYFNATASVTVDIANHFARSTNTVGDDAGVGVDNIIGGVNSITGSGFGDFLYGSDNAANTTEFFEGRAGNDFIDGRGGFDQAVYNIDANVGVGITVNLAAGTVIGGAFVGTDTLRSIESVIGTNFNDTFDASNFGISGANVGDFGTFNQFEGAAGDDQITGNGNTRITFFSATAGVVVNLATGDVQGNASVGHDTITNAIAGGVRDVSGSNFNDTITGTAFADFLQGNGGDDTISGGAGNDSLGGGSGNDVLAGGTGDDYLSGNQGADTFVYASGDGADTISDFSHAEGDKIDLTGLDGIYSFADIQSRATAAGPGSFIDFGGGNTLSLLNVAPGSLVAGDFIFAAMPTNQPPVAHDDLLAPPPPSGSGWALNAANGHYYRLVDSDLSWDDANAAATIDGGYLATITSQAEQDFITPLTTGHRVWLGGGSTDDANGPGHFFWLTGPEAGQPFGYTNWRVDSIATEPNGGFGAVEYVHIEGVETLNGWNDAPGVQNGRIFLEEWGGRAADANVNEDSTLTIGAATLLANDTDVNVGDTLTVTAVGGISTTGVSAHGATVMLNGANIVYDPTAAAEFQALAQGQMLTDTFSYTISDGHGGNSNATVTVSVTGVNDAPVLDLDTTTDGFDYQATFDVGGNDVAIAGDVSVSDIDSPIIHSAFLQISGPPNLYLTDQLYLDESLLDPVLAALVSSEQSGGQGSKTLAITGDATPAEYAEILQAVRFSSSADQQNIDFGPRTLTVTINDGVEDSNAATVAITVQDTGGGDNQPPVVYPDTNSIDEDSLLSGAVPNAFDSDGFVASYHLDQTVSEGQLTFGPEGNYTFDPRGAFDDLAQGVTRDVTFTYYATDDQGANSASETVTITVIGVNDAPVLTNATLSPDTAKYLYSIFDSSHFSDQDGDGFSGIAISAVSADPQTQGVWQYGYSGNPGTWTDIPSDVTQSHAFALNYGYELRFVSVPNFDGTLSPTLTVYALDSNLGQSSGQGEPVYIDVTQHGGSTHISDFATLSANEAPVAGADQITIRADFAGVGSSLTGNDHDSDGPDSSLRIYDARLNGGTPVTPDVNGIIELHGNYGTLLIYTLAAQDSYFHYPVNAGDYIYLINNDGNGQPLADNPIFDLLPGDVATEGGFQYRVADHAGAGAVSNFVNIAVTIEPSYVVTAVQDVAGADTTPALLWSYLHDATLTSISGTQLVYETATGPGVTIVTVDAKGLDWTGDVISHDVVLTDGLIKGFHVAYDADGSDGETPTPVYYSIHYSITTSDFQSDITADDSANFASRVAEFGHTVYGSDGDDMLSGGNLDDRIDTGSTGSGADIVHAGGGNDLIVVHDDHGWFVDGGDGIDTLRFANSVTTGVTPPGSTGVNLEIVDLNKAGEFDGGAVSILIDGEGASAMNQLGPAGTGLIRILGDSQDTVRFDDQFDAHPNGHWIAGASPADIHTPYFGDSFTGGVYFNTYFYMDNTDTLATAYVEQGVIVTGSFVPFSLSGDNVSVAESGLGDGVTTVFDAAILDSDLGAQLTVTATAEHGAVSAVINQQPVQLNTGVMATVSEINAVFDGGVTYTPTDYNDAVQLNDIVTLTVTDSNGLRDSLHFVFQQSGPGGTPMAPVQLVGTDGKDIIFSTGGDDLLTGNAGHDNFVFAPGNGNDAIFDFTIGEDRIDLRQFATPNSSNIESWLDSHTSSAPFNANDTVIDFDPDHPGQNSILVKGVAVGHLHANDFILHPS